MFSELRFVSVYMNSQGCIKPGHQVDMFTKFVHWQLILVRPVCGACFIVHPSRILNWLLDFWKICATLIIIIIIIYYYAFIRSIQGYKPIGYRTCHWI